MPHPQHNPILVIALGLLTGACQYDNPYLLQADPGPHAIGAEVSATASDRCSAGSSTPGEECEDDLIESIELISSEFELVSGGKLLDIAPGELSVPFAVRSELESGRLCVWINGDRECALTSVIPIDDYALASSCENNRTVQTGVTFNVDVVSYGRGEVLNTTGLAPGWDLEVTGATQTEPGTFVAPDSPGEITIRERTYGDTLGFTAIDPVAEGWSFTVTQDTLTSISFDIDFPTGAPCFYRVSPDVSSATPDVCTIAPDPAGGFTVSRIHQGTCSLSFSLAEGLSPQTLEFEIGHAVFVTSMPFEGNLGGLAGADGICATLAGAAGRTEDSWVAVLSDNGANAIDRVSISGPVYSVKDELLFADQDAFWNPVGRPLIQLDELGDFHANASVWTGTTQTGTFGPDCEEWTTNSFLEKAIVGRTGGLGSAWIDEGDGLCNGDRRLYCVSQ